MKKLMFVLFLLLQVVFIYGQDNKYNDDDSDDFTSKKNGRKECDTRVQRADSVVSFAYDSITGNYTPVRVTYYSYDADYNLTEVIARSLPARAFLIHQIFEYNNDGNMVGYINQLWVNENWQNDLINERTYNSAGHILTEVFMRKNTAGEFAPYQRHFYTYEGDVIVSYLRQVKDTTGNWYDLSHHYYIYDSMGRLTVLYGQYINSGLVFWERTAIYDSEEKISERYLKVLRYNFTLKKNILANELYQKYSFNIYGNVVAILSYGFTNQELTFTGVDSTYYSMLPDNKKVSICHNGNSICISINALDIHLRHGDKLGLCDDGKMACEKEKTKKASTENPENKFSVYHNPAKDHINIKFDENDNPYSKGYIISSGGKVIKSFSGKGQKEINLDI